MQTAVGTVDAPGSSPTLCRMERQAARADVVTLIRFRVNQIIAAQSQPTELIFDSDDSDIALHVDQERTELHACYDHDGYLPLDVFCGRAMLSRVLRNSRIDGARHVAAVIKFLLARLRRVWPQVRIFVHKNSGFCRRRLIRWCEHHGIDCFIGMARIAIVADRKRQLDQRHTGTGEKQPAIYKSVYAAGSWNRERRRVTRQAFGNQCSRRTYGTRTAAPVNRPSRKRLSASLASARAIGSTVMSRCTEETSFMKSIPS